MQDVITMAGGSLLTRERQPAGTRHQRRRAARQPVLSHADLVPHDRAASPRERVAGPHADSEMRLVLREAALVAAQTALHARSLTALLERLLTTVTTPVPPADCAEPVGGTFRLETAPLSPREREVLALVAEGRSNKAIAAALFVSPNTIKTHVASLLTKLEADTRVQLAAIAAGDAQRGPWLRPGLPRNAVRLHTASRTAARRSSGVIEREKPQMPSWT